MYILCGGYVDLQLRWFLRLLNECVCVCVCCMLCVVGVLVACKSDLVQRREVSEKRGREMAASKDLHYFETSAVS